MDRKSSVDCQLPADDERMDCPPTRDMTLPIVEERPVITTNTIVTGVVRVSTETRLDTVEIDTPLEASEVAVERVPVDRWIDAPPEVRQEGETTIYPVVAEVPVVMTRLKLVEEVRVTRHRTIRHAPQHLTLRRQAVTVERRPAPSATDPGEP
jgi:stress response protein YsnF